MKIDEITKFFDDIETIDIEKEVAEKLFKTDSNGNPIIGQYINGYEGINFQNLVAMARRAAASNPRQERKAIDDLVDAEIKKHLEGKKKKEEKPKKEAPPPKSDKPAKEKPKFTGVDDVQKDLKGFAGWIQKKLKSGTSIADKYTKVSKK